MGGTTDLDWLLREYRGWRGFLAGPWGEFSTGIAIDMLIDLPFFYAEVIANPYLNLEQKWWRGGVMVVGWIFGGLVGLAVPGVLPGIVAGVAAGLFYEYIFAPYFIRPAAIRFFGVDPYDDSLRLSPLQ